MEKSIISNSCNKEIAGFGQKAWVKQLASCSGMPLMLHQHAAGKRIVYLVLDCSTSMARKGKISHAKEGSISFALEAVEKDYVVGLISFASEAKHLLEPRHDISCIKNALEVIKARGSTNMADAIIMAAERLSRMQGEKIITIVTDGQPDSDDETLEAAEVAKNAGISIMCIGTDDADTRFLEKLATRKELSAKVEAAYLRQGITRMAGLLPDKRSVLQITGGA